MNTQLGQGTEHSVSRWVLMLLLLAVAFPWSFPALAAEQVTPKLIWEKEFPVRHISAVGVDAEYYARSGGDIEGSLKWVFSTGGLYCFDRRGEIRTRPIEGTADPEAFSENGKYLCVGRRAERLWKWEITVHTIFDWNTGVLWQTDDEILRWPLVRNDGSAVSFWGWVGDECYYLLAARFYDRWGKLRNVHRFPKGQERLVYGMSSSMFVLCTVGEREGHEICVFDTRGRLIWRKAVIGEPGFQPREIGVSNRCEVVLRMEAERGPEAVVLVYSGLGVLTDTLRFSDYARCSDVKVFGSKAFLTITSRRWDFTAGSYLLKYDLDQMKPEITHRTGPGYRLAEIRGDIHAGLIAVSTFEFNREGYAVRIFDLDGQFVAEIPNESTTPVCHPFRVLDGGLLVAEGNKLKLYEIDVE